MSLGSSWPQPLSVGNTLEHEDSLRAPQTFFANEGPLSRSGSIIFPLRRPDACGLFFFSPSSQMLTPPRRFLLGLL